ncbi:ATP-grasp domain-containing protein [Peribacillus simplex]|uniref:ATP-grasp domain-containing protein n=1 Tax=Peribacillus simplex TaxID=1478 RepID=UPI0021A9FE15|nr:ATP-grasp domain-containing protein [Peribacillus simplex]
MKKLLFVESNTTGTGMLALQQAKELGYEPVLLTNDPLRYTGLAKQGSTVIQCNTNKIQDVLQAIHTHMVKDQLAGITTTSEFYIEMVALLNEHFEFKGNPSEVVRKIRNKASVRTVLNASQTLYQPAYITVRSAQDVMSLERADIPFPCIVKPVDDSGSNFVKKCNTHSDVMEQVQRIAAITHNVRGQETSPYILIEEYVEGQEYSVECFSYRSTHTVIGITKKFVGEGPYFVETGHVFPAPVDLHLAELIEQGTCEILQRMDWCSGPAHLEVKIKDGKVFLVEFNGRLAGGMIPELIRYATGTDLLKEQLKGAAGIKPTVSTEIRMVAGIRHLVPDRKGSISVASNGIGSQIPGIKSWKLFVHEGELVEKAVNAYGRIGYIIAVGQSQAEVEEILQEGEKELALKIQEEVLH